MFKRNIITELEKWSKKKGRKPLVLRGARQVGKTTVVSEFAKQFDQYIYLNLEVPYDREAFENFENMEDFLQSIFFLKDMQYAKRNKTLIFIDEIQEVPEALNILRFFYEQTPQIPVIAAGSLLETIFNNKMNFPVGRVEFMVMRPVSFTEFLAACNEIQALEQLQHVPLKNFAHQKLLHLFHTYALIGGMPEVVQNYAQNKDLSALVSMYDSLLTAYFDDVEKYADNNTQLQVIRHLVKSCFFEAGKRIKFQGFAKSAYGSKEIGDAFRTLEKTMLINLVYPCTGSNLPMLPEIKKSPRLHVLDTGLMNYMLGLQKEMLGKDDLSAVYQGTLIEHLVGQELMSNQYNALGSLNFWVREKNSSMAEVDYVIAWQGKLIPIEVKSGKEGKLKSLHLFMDEAKHPFAVRFYAGEFSLIEATSSKGKKYHLLNLPYFLVSQLPHYLEWMVGEVEKLANKKLKKK